MSVVNPRIKSNTSPLSSVAIFSCLHACSFGGGGLGASHACHKSPHMRARFPRSTEASSPDWGCHDTDVTAVV